MKTCLLVDDAPVIRKVATRILLQHGLTVHAVALVDDARAYLKASGLPSLALVSATPTEAAGVELVREICQAAKGRECVVLAVIVEANLGLMTRLKRAGAAGYVLKPFDRETLATALAPYLDTTQAA